MALYSLSPGKLSSFTSPRRSQRWCDIAKSVEDLQSRVYRPVVGYGVQGLNANLDFHRFMNSVEVEQTWRGSSLLASHNRPLPMVLRNRWRSSADAHNSPVWLPGSFDGTLLHKENMNTGMACRAQIHSEPWNDESSPVELSSLLHTGITHTGSEVRQYEAFVFHLL